MFSLLSLALTLRRVLIKSSQKLLLCLYPSWWDYSACSHLPFLLGRSLLTFSLFVRRVTLLILQALESILQICEHISAHNLISDCQYGFFRGQSTGNLEFLNESWSSSLWGFNETFSVALDMSTAFDIALNKTFNLETIPSWFLFFCPYLYLKFSLWSVYCYYLLKVVIALSSLPFSHSICYLFHRPYLPAHVWWWYIHSHRSMKQVKNFSSHQFPSSNWLPKLSNPTA